MLPETLVLVNPVAGGGAARRVLPAVASYLAQQNHSADFAESESTADLRARAAEGVQRGYRNIIALGGDGTFHHLVEAALGSCVQLGFFPAGHGNDLASSLGIPSDAVAAASAFLRSRPHHFDVAEMRFPGADPAHPCDAGADRFAPTVLVGAGGIGLDAEAAQLANTRFARWPSAFRYIAGALQAFRHFPPLDVELELDGTIERDRALFVAVANAPYYGSGIRIAPAAKMDDGLLDVVLVRPVDWTRMVDAIPMLLLSGDTRWSELRRFRARHLQIRTSRPALVHSAGEIVGATPVELEVLPGAISIVVPNQSMVEG
ncbi:MAG: diacylglycerol kinase family protein [Candidatus Acidiferrales bacterium]